MKTINHILLSLVLITWACQPETTPPSFAQHHELRAKLDSVTNKAWDQNKLLGMSVAMLQGNDTIYRRVLGYSDTARAAQVKAEERFLMASISKLIGATVIMRLVELDYLTLDQTIDQLLPEFPNPQQASKITMRHMISHTSGLQDYAAEIDTVYEQTGKDPTPEILLDFFDERPLLFEPGEAYSYCNSGFLLMAMIAERLTGKTWQSLIDEHINSKGPWDMRLIGEVVNDPLMTPYFELQESGFIPRAHWPWIKGDGGLTVKPLELAHFPSYWANGKIISDSSFNQMITPTVLNNGIQTGYGLGVRTGNIEGTTVIGHTGGHKSNYAIMMYIPDHDLSIVVCINTDNTPLQARNIAGQLALVALNKSYPNYLESDQQLLDGNQYTGTYAYPGYKIEESIMISHDPQTGHLYYHLDGVGKYQLHPIGGDTFWIEEWPMDRVVFARDPGGQIKGLQEYYQGFYVVLRLKKE